MANKHKHGAKKSQPRPKAKAHHKKRSPRKGGAKSLLKTVAKSALSGFTSLAGKSLGGPLGSIVGRLGGDLIGSISGLGSYKVRGNTLMSDNGPPIFNGKQSTTVIHREYLGPINSSTGFAIAGTYSLNPGLTTTFPWLAQLAANYEQYELLGCVFEFKSTSATAVSSTNTSLGTVIMATQYDPYHLPFPDKQAMEAYEFCTSCVPSTNMIHPIECKPSLTPVSELFVRWNGEAISGDQRLYDLGTVYVATSGQQVGGVELGELWVSYHVKLIKPRLPSGVGYVSYANKWVGLPSGGAGNHVMLDDTKIAPNSSAAGVTLFNQSNASWLRFTRPGRYLVLVHATAAIGGLIRNVGFSSITNGTIMASWNGNSDTNPRFPGTGNYDQETATFSIIDANCNVQNGPCTVNIGFLDFNNSTSANVTCYAAMIPGTLQDNPSLSEMELLKIRLEELEMRVRNDDDGYSDVTTPMLSRPPTPRTLQRSNARHF